MNAFKYCFMATAYLIPVQRHCSGSIHPALSTCTTDDDCPGPPELCIVDEAHTRNEGGIVGTAIDIESVWKYCLGSGNLANSVCPKDPYTGQPMRLEEYANTEYFYKCKPGHFKLHPSIGICRDGETTCSMVEETSVCGHLPGGAVEECHAHFQWPSLMSYLWCFSNTTTVHRSSVEASSLCHEGDLDQTCTPLIGVDKCSAFRNSTV
jgi:hypothetical protein